MFKEDFLDRFFPLEWREKKMVEFMNLRKGGMNVKEYSLIFTQLFEYATTIVANPRSRMNKFVMGVSNLVQKECHTTMIFYYMVISRLRVYARQTEESKIREISKEGKRNRSYEQGKPKPKKMFYYQGSSLGNKDRDPNKNSQGGDQTFERSRCATCGKQHLGKCLA